jgi:hypothetical protein
MQTNPGPIMQKYGKENKKSEIKPYPANVENRVSS